MAMLINISAIMEALENLPVDYIWEDFTDTELTTVHGFNIRERDTGKSIVSVVSGWGRYCTSAVNYEVWTPGTFEGAFYNFTMCGGTCGWVPADEIAQMIILITQGVPQS